MKIDRKTKFAGNLVVIMLRIPIVYVQMSRIGSRRKIKSYFVDKDAFAEDNISHFIRPRKNIFYICTVSQAHRVAADGQINVTSPAA